MKTLALIAISLLILLCEPCAAHPAAQVAPGEVPFILEKGYVIVPAKINGNQTVDVALSTGAEYSLINVQLLNKYKLKAAYAGEGLITGSNLDRVVYFVPVADLRVGDARATTLNMRFGAQAASDISIRVGREIFAVLGADFLKGRVVQFDFGKKVLRFLPQTPSGLKEIKSGTANERAVLPIRPRAEGVALPIVENVTFEGKKIKTLIDTGALTVISLTPSAARLIGLSPPPDKGAPRADKIGSLRFGDMELTGLPVMVHAKGSGFDGDAVGYGAVVGIALLQNFVVTFDFHDNVVILERI